jgi:hypothetical protein
MSLLLKNTFQSIILSATGASEILENNVIQKLWSGYGKISRLKLKNGYYSSVVVKHVHFPNEDDHPRGWNTNFSHLRKLKSYQVEVAWYRNWSELCDDTCRIPSCIALDSDDDEVLMVMEDLDVAGFPIRKIEVGLSEMKACLSWLANFHATFMEERPNGLWETGTYWHLETRPDELIALDDLELKSVAGLIDDKLKQAKYQTFVHGDAKLANFCFSPDGNEVAAVDFQYVGGGCGMKDVAYFIGSCLYENECKSMEKKLLDIYFSELKIAIQAREKFIDLEELEEEWRKMFPLTWTDFHRFLKGWSPGHWKINSYSEQIARNVIESLKMEK